MRHSRATGRPGSTGRRSAAGQAGLLQAALSLQRKGRAQLDATEAHDNSPMGFFENLYRLVRVGSSDRALSLSDLYELDQVSSLAEDSTPS